MALPTLLTDRRYFGLDPVSLRAAAGRVVLRVAGLSPERARVSVRHLRRDFGLDTVAGALLVEELVAERLLQPSGTDPNNYHITGSFAEIASARVVEPLPRARARALVGKATALALRVNETWVRNPLCIEAVATFGDYMSRDERLAELSLGVVVVQRPATRRARWSLRGMTTKSEGADAIRSAFRALSSFIVVRLVRDPTVLSRPFAVVFRADRTT